MEMMNEHSPRTNSTFQPSSNQALQPLPTQFTGSRLLQHLFKLLSLSLSLSLSPHFGVNVIDCLNPMRFSSQFSLVLCTRKLSASHCTQHQRNEIIHCNRTKKTFGFSHSFFLSCLVSPVRTSTKRAFAFSSYNGAHLDTWLRTKQMKNLIR